MSDYQNHISSVTKPETNKLRICLFSTKQQLSNLVVQLLDGDRYDLECFDSKLDFSDFIGSNREAIDCIIIIQDPEVEALLKHLWQSEILLPAIILQLEQPQETLLEIDSSNGSLVHLAKNNIYHPAEIYLYSTQLAEINLYVDLAISKFVNFAPISQVCDCTATHQSSQIHQHIATQHRLTQKIKDRLSHSENCDRRNPQFFYKNLSESKQKELRQKLTSNYRNILIDYFDDRCQIEKSIDEFVAQAFFNNISTSQIIEIHMDLIDNFAHQLKIEGRSDDILIDYRLPLIDIMAHLCEMYRRYTCDL